MRGGAHYKFFACIYTNFAGTVIYDMNKSERHIRGGLATRRKYKGDK
jgi:hypothetical protein